jgi:hypothetical protein
MRVPAKHVFVLTIAVMSVASCAALAVRQRYEELAQLQRYKQQAWNDMFTAKRLPTNAG